MTGTQLVEVYPDATLAEYASWIQGGHQPKSLEYGHRFLVRETSPAELAGLFGQTLGQYRVLPYTSYQGVPYEAIAIRVWGDYKGRKVSEGIMVYRHPVC